MHLDCKCGLLVLDLGELATFTCWEFYLILSIGLCYFLADVKTMPVC